MEIATEALRKCFSLLMVDYCHIKIAYFSYFSQKKNPKKKKKRNKKRRRRNSISSWNRFFCFCYYFCFVTFCFVSFSLRGGREENFLENYVGFVKTAKNKVKDKVITTNSTHNTCTHMNTKCRWIG